MTGGQLIAVLEHCLEFDEKDEFLKLCKEMSGIRNKLVHELARKVNQRKLKATTDKYREKYRRAEEVFFEADNKFWLLYKDSRKDDSWDELLQDMLDDGLNTDTAAECKRVIELRKACCGMVS